MCHNAAHDHLWIEVLYRTASGTHMAVLLLTLRPCNVHGASTMPAALVNVDVMKQKSNKKQENLT